MGGGGGGWEEWLSLQESFSHSWEKLEKPVGRGGGTHPPPLPLGHQRINVNLAFIFKFACVFKF